MSLSNYELRTFQDAVEHVLDARMGSDAAEANRRRARRCVDEALRQLYNYRNWSYYYRRVQIITTAQQMTGSIAYDHTGGAAERLVTLTDATWPSDAEFYELMVSGVRYEIDKRLTSTTLTLTERANPGSDLAAGTSYTLQRDVYPLPDDFGSMGRLIDVATGGLVLCELTTDEWMSLTRIVRTAGVPYAYAFTRHPKYAGGRALALAPTPTAARTYDAIYRARPLPLRTEKEDTGTVSIAAGSATVTGSGTAFSQAHVGAVIRVATDGTDLPTSPLGNLEDLLNAYAFQGVIRSVESATAATLEQAADATVADGSFVISSRIDVEVGSMYTALLAIAMAKFAGGEDREELMREAREELMRAAEADNASFPASPNVPIPTRLGDIASSITR